MIDWLIDWWRCVQGAREAFVVLTALIDYRAGLIPISDNHHRRRRRGAGGSPPPKKKKIRAKNYFFSGKNRVKLGHFVNFSCIYFRAKMSCPPKVNWAPTPMIMGNFFEWRSSCLTSVFRCMQSVSKLNVMEVHSIACKYTHHNRLTLQSADPTEGLYIKWENKPLILWSCHPHPPVGIWAWIHPACQISGLSRSAPRRWNQEILIRFWRRIPICMDMSVNFCIQPVNAV